MAGQDRWMQPLGLSPARVGSIVLILAIVAFAWAQSDLAARNGLWADEYFSLWASDPAEPLGELLAARILPDTNPPLFFSALALMRPFVEDPRAAFLTLNIIALIMVAVFVGLTGRRAAMPATALGAIALFLISGPVLCFAPEGRAYLMGLCAAFAISWSAALALERPVDRGALIAFAVLGALAALTHVFAALFAGAFGAALLAEGGLRRRLDLVRAGLVLGGSAALVFGAWLPMVLASMGNIAWIEFTLGAIREALWYVRQLTFGHTLIALAVAGFLALSVRRAAMRPYLRVFAIAMALFFILPILASFITPLVVGRYWLIGEPAILVLAVFAVRAQLLAPREPLTLAVAAGGVVALLAASLLGFFNAQGFTQTKPIWRGAAIVAPLLAACEAGSVRVSGAPLYATASGAAEATFEYAEAPGLPVRAVGEGDCPVVGWAEHVRRGDDYLATASDEALLDILKLEGEGARIVRHDSGFVVLRPEAPDIANP
ncbi:MAG TPA: hypothetical protein PKY87_02980 [Terricaulis sp.]|nr:hypothetical protein [Terricaulis sp.]